MNDPRELQQEAPDLHTGPLEMRMPADPRLVLAVRLTASGIAASARCTIAEIDDVKLAVSEVMLALIEHGSGRALSVSLELTDSTFAIRGETETRTFNRDHPDLALCETVLAEVCTDHTIDVVGSTLQICAVIHLSRSDEC
jgi:hypothetical protein